MESTQACQGPRHFQKINFTKVGAICLICKIAFLKSASPKFTISAVGIGKKSPPSLDSTITIFYAGYFFLAVYAFYSCVYQQRKQWESHKVPHKHHTLCYCAIFTRPYCYVICQHAGHSRNPCIQICFISKPHSKL